MAALLRISAMFYRDPPRAPQGLDRARGDRRRRAVRRRPHLADIGRRAPRGGVGIAPAAPSSLSRAGWPSWPWVACLPAIGSRQTV